MGLAKQQKRLAAQAKKQGKVAAAALKEAKSAEEWTVPVKGMGPIVNVILPSILAAVVGYKFGAQVLAEGSLVQNVANTIGLGFMGPIMLLGLMYGIFTVSFFVLFPFLLRWKNLTEFQCTFTIAYVVGAFANDFGISSSTIFFVLSVLVATSYVANSVR